MTLSGYNLLVEQGMAAIDRGDTLNALVLFEDAAVLAKTPTVLSCLGYCLAREHRQMTRGITLCMEALQQEPRNALHYLNLGRIYLVAGEKTLAMQTFRQGIRLERHPGIIREMRKLVSRRQPVFPALPPENPLNRCLGYVVEQLGWR